MQRRSRADLSNFYPRKSIAAMARTLAILCTVALLAVAADAASSVSKSLSYLLLASGGSVWGLCCALVSLRSWPSALSSCETVSARPARMLGCKLRCAVSLTHPVTSCISIHRFGSLTSACAALEADVWVCAAALSSIQPAKLQVNVSYMINGVSVMPSAPCTQQAPGSSCLPVPHAVR